MYKIYIDNLLIHNDIYDKLKLDSPTLDIELNQAGELKFSIYPNHPYYEKFNYNDDPARFKKMKSIVRVEREGELIFKGRILEIEEGFYKDKQVTCEGELAFFIDSQLRPYSITGTPQEVLAFYINAHNEQMESNPEKKFVIGTVTITDGDTSNNENIITRSNSSIVNVWSEISSKLLESLGGYLIIDTNGSGERQINWYSEDDFLFGTQSIDFGKNLLDLKINIKGDEIVTALIPLGGEVGTSTEGETQKRLTIESIADGVVATPTDDVIIKTKDYIYSEKAVEEYGWIFATETWDDVSEDKNQLLRNGINRLNELNKAVESIEINAVDLYKKENVAAFKLGTKINVTSKFHNLSGEDFPITKISLNLSNPSSNTLTLKKSERSFTESSASVNKLQVDVGNVVQRVETVINNASGYEEKINSNEEKINANNQAITETIEKLTSTINQTSQEIISEVNEKYALKDETETLIAEVKTQIQQTNDEVEIRFVETSQNMNNYQSGVNAQFTEINKYIRFKDGNILLGEEGNELTLNIQNDRISFLESGSEVAYFSNRKLYVLDGEFLNTLRLGNFAFLPRANGNVSFKKVN